MKKNSLLFIVFLVVAIAASAQAYEGSIKYDKKNQKAFVIEYAYPPEAVQNAIMQKLEKIGYTLKEEKGLFNRDKGFLVCTNAYISDISEEKMDYIIKVERKSRKASDESVLYFIVNKDGENAMDKMQSYDAGRAKLFLNNMLPDIEAANLELQITDQEAVVAKAEKKLKELQDEQQSLEKKLNENKKGQEDTQKDIEQQKKNLGELRNKRKSN